MHSPVPANFGQLALPGKVSTKLKREAPRSMSLPLCGQQSQRGRFMPFQPARLKPAKSVQPQGRFQFHFRCLPPTQSRFQFHFQSHALIKAL
jgi:hypothetical protein